MVKADEGLSLTAVIAFVPRPKGAGQSESRGLAPIVMVTATLTIRGPTNRGAGYPPE